jgi:hypothetical protein
MGIHVGRLVCFVTKLFKMQQDVTAVPNNIRTNFRSFIVIMSFIIRIRQSLGFSIAVVRVSGSEGTFQPLLLTTQMPMKTD